MPDLSSPLTTLSARELVLAIIDSSARPDLTVSYLIAAGQLFEIEPSAIRVGLARLVKNGVLEQPERGRYRLGAGGASMHAVVSGWADVEERLVPWNGDWIAAHVGPLTRSDKKKVRLRERALALRGFAPLDGLWVRPANLAATLADLRRELVDLGLDVDAPLYRIADADPRSAISHERLWDRRALEAGYEIHIAELAASRRRVERLEVPARAREMLLLGRAVTRDIVMDPLLPRELVDVRLRRRMIADMKAYNRDALRCWAAFRVAVEA